jgi:hypothetical protein
MEHQHRIYNDRLLAGHQARSLAALYILQIVNSTTIAHAKPEARTRLVGEFSRSILVFWG